VRVPPGAPPAEPPLARRLGDAQPPPGAACYLH